MEALPPLWSDWPNGITVPGTFNSQRFHLIDFHATFRELAEVNYPFDQSKHLLALRGISVFLSFEGEKREEHSFYYQNLSNKKIALVIGRLKLVNSKTLYEIETNWIESKDLSTSSPQKF